MSSPRHASRHRSREVALQVLFAIDLGTGKDGAKRPGSEEAFEAVAEHFELPEGARAFAKELVTGVVAHRVELDEQIAAHARNWRVSRMATLDRNVLRLGAYELRYTDTALAVVVDEAIELVRRFGGDRSPPFVNGILDAIARGAHDSGGAEP